MIGALIATWRKRHKASTAYNYRSKLKALLTAMVPFGLAPMRVPKVPLPQIRATIASGDELYRLLKEPPAFLRLFMLLYLQCGLRRSEALAVTPRTWDREHHTVTIRVKGGRMRTAQITDDVEHLLVSAGDPEPDTSYIDALRGRHISDSGIRTAWRTHRRKCGVNPDLTAHDLRRTAATILYHATKDLRVPQQLLGHKNLASTLSYLAPMAPDEARKYQELLRFEHFKSEVKQ
jgi:integrase